jgi:hypothetical protein
VAGLVGERGAHTHAPTKAPAAPGPWRRRQTLPVPGDDRAWRSSSHKTDISTHTACLRMSAGGYSPSNRCPCPYT